MNRGSVEEVVSHLGVARDTVYRWIESKGLRAHCIGRLWKFNLSEVDDWVPTAAPRSGRDRACRLCTTKRRGSNGETKK